MMRTSLLITALLCIIASTSSSDPNANTIPLDDDDDDDTEEVYSEMMDETTTLSDMWDILDCDDIFEAEQRPIHNESTWAYLRGSYIASVGYHNSSIGYDQIYGNGFAPDSIIVKHHPVKGRAVYATKPFKKGDMIWNDIYMACFEEGHHYRHFLASIPAHLACDVFEWAYSAKGSGVCVDLDEGSLVNHANTIAKIQDLESGEDRPNLQGRVATRNIRAGEEILTDYSTFAEDEGWAELGLGGWGGVFYAENYYDDPEDDDDDIEETLMKEEL